MVPPSSSASRPSPPGGLRPALTPAAGGAVQQQSGAGRFQDQIRWTEVSTVSGIAGLAGIGRGLVFGLVDPNGSRWGGHRRWSSVAAGAGLEAGIEQRLPFRGRLNPAAVVDTAGGEPSQSAVAMLIVVTVEECRDPRLSVLVAVENARAIHVVLHSLEQRLRKRVVIRHMRPGPGPADLQAG